MGQKWSYIADISKELLMKLFMKFVCKIKKMFILEGHKFLDQLQAPNHWLDLKFFFEGMYLPAFLTQAYTGSR